MGFHSEKRAGVRDPRFRSLTPKAQEAISGTSFATLKRIYDELDERELRAAVSRLDTATDTTEGERGAASG
ncbi:MAG TPA: hypothetical protein VK837_00310 [Longimicrobiales bacterium]|nr:hypothetical protein [Longimicrobiales bacterium]